MKHSELVVRVNYNKSEIEHILEYINASKHVC